MLSTLLFLLASPAHAEAPSARTSAFVSLSWRGYAMADHLSHGQGFSAGASLFHDQLRLGLAGTTRPGPINPATFALDVSEAPYKGQDTLQLRSDGGGAGLLIAPGHHLAQGRLYLSAPIILGYGGYGFYLVGEDRETPDGAKPSAWEDELLAGADSAFGLLLDAGLQLSLVSPTWGLAGQVRPTLGVHVHAILGYDATYADRYAGPSVSLGVEVRPNRGPAR